MMAGGQPPVLLRVAWSWRVSEKKIKLLIVIETGQVRQSCVLRQEGNYRPNEVIIKRGITVGGETKQRKSVKLSNFKGCHGVIPQSASRNFHCSIEMLESYRCHCYRPQYS